MVQLDVYVNENCWSCDETRAIVAAVRSCFPEVRTRLITQDGTPWPAEVFAVPTYVLDGRVISLGNPSRTALNLQLEAARLNEQGPSIDDTYSPKHM